MDLSTLDDKQRKALDILAELSGKPVDGLAANAELVADLNIDSPKALQFLLQLEEALDIEIDDEDAAKMDSVGDVLDYLDGLAG
ncbi:MAG: phosphopantetheine-binding protein [Acidobacteriota bacterium]